jgi:hypothetical protein
VLPGVISVADAHHREVRRLSAVATLAARRVWSRVNPTTVLDDWANASRALLPTITNLQVLAATAGSGYIGDTLDSQDIRADPDAVVVPSAWSGVASDGRPLASLLEAATLTVRSALQQQLPAEEAFDRGRRALEQIVHTQIGDAARVSAGVDIATRPRVGWVRMVNPPTCSRCLVLAGRFYRWSSGFDRHPRDDCISVPTTQANARREGFVDDPQKYLESLSRDEQDRMLGKAGAQAVRDGADLNQVVNARRGMETASVGGRNVLTTTVNARKGQVRVMPETIYREATSRADALRLLQLHGFIR